MNRTETAPPDTRPTKSQRALAAARAVCQFKADAKNRQRAGACASAGVKGKSTYKAAAQFGVSPRAVELALFVIERGIPELVQAIENGKVRVTAAVKVARLPADAQGKVVADIIAGRPLPDVLTDVHRTNDVIEPAPVEPPRPSTCMPTPPGGLEAPPPDVPSSPVAASRTCPYCGQQPALTGERFCDNCHRIFVCIDNGYAAEFYRRRAKR